MKKCGRFHAEVASRYMYATSRTTDAGAISDTPIVFRHVAKRSLIFDNAHERLIEIEIGVGQLVQGKHSHVNG